MSRRPSGTRIRHCGAFALLAVLALPSLAAAQGGPGFRFAEPNVTLKLETGYGLLFANSQIFDQTIDELTVKRRDFDAPFVGAELAIRASERWDVAVGIGFSQSDVRSEFRDWVDTNDLPIEQTTELRLIPVTVSGKYYFNDRGRRVGRFAWIPRTFAPYVGAGVGVVSYRFEQIGDFVDFDTFDIFFDRFDSRGNAALLRGLAGMAVSLGAHVELSGEMRYSYASAEMSSDFDGYDPLDLSGFQGVVGIGLRF